MTATRDEAGYDVIVIGAGPSGEVAAGRLAGAKSVRDGHAGSVAPGLGVFVGGWFGEAGLPVDVAQGAGEGEELQGFVVGVAGLGVGEVHQDGPAVEEKWNG